MGRKKKKEPLPPPPPVINDDAAEYASLYDALEAAPAPAEQHTEQVEQPSNTSTSSVVVDRSGFAATLPLHVRKGQIIPYITFVPTVAFQSTMPNAGTGLAAVEPLAPFTWVGLYPGSVTPKPNKKRAAHTMGSSNDNLIIADEAVKEGVHMINEATTPCVANTWYVKLENGYCLYFTGGEIPANLELLTCYSRNYMKRCYSVPKQCSDPRCTSAKHRTHSDMLEEWRQPLVEHKPSGISEQFLQAAGLVAKNGAAVPPATESTMAEM